jgi:aspartyl/asparaginyl beta-hydroxylase (cupin superfamily)
MDETNQIPIVKSPWYSVWGERYVGDQPPFYTTSNLPWTTIMEDNWEVLRTELLQLIEDKPDRLKPYFINKTMSFPPQHWKTMGLYYWRFRIHRNCRRCPETKKIIKSIGNVMSFSISVLEPGSNINPHQGDTDAIIRCHLGLIIPGTLPDLGFQVGKEIRTWEEGKCLPFCDAITHTAWNHTDKTRVIVNFDVIRPELKHKKNRVCAHVLASSVMQMLYPRISSVKMRSGYWRRAIYHVVRVLILGFLPLQRISGIGK